MAMKRFLATAAVIGVAVAVAHAKPPFQRGGHSGGGSGSAQACDPSVPTLCAQYQDGQTIVTWDDVGTDGAGGASTRYRVYRSTSPITSGNYTSATLIASYIPNNSAQLAGGDPAASTENPYLQTYRQNGTRPRSKLTDAGAMLDAFTGMQVYTALGTANAYYAVVSTDTSDGSLSYIGSAGPISESVATPQPILAVASADQAEAAGRVTSPAGKPLIWVAHASTSPGSCAGTVSCTRGDIWESFGIPAEGWQDGTKSMFGVTEDGVGGTGTFLSLSGPLVIRIRDSVYDPLDADGTIETFHQGLGMTPNALVGSANRLYRGTAKRNERLLAWTIDHYGLDANQVHHVGQSMGAWAAIDSIRTFDPGVVRVSAGWWTYPIWRMDLRNSAGWAGLTWAATMPFKATVAAAPSTLGTTASSVLMDDGTTFGGTGGYADLPTFIASDPGTDLPVSIWAIGKDDQHSNWQSQITAKDAFQDARRGHAFCWSMANHDNPSTMGPIDRDGSGAMVGVAYSKSQFQLDLAYPAFSNSSIDDDPGTATRDSANIYDGDPQGCVNAGFTWTITADTASAFEFTVGNAWMGLSPTSPTTTLTSGIDESTTGTFTVASGAAFSTVTFASSVNFYFVIDEGTADAEIINVASVSGDTVDINARGRLNTTGKAHLSGATIRQYITKPTGPNAGAQSTMTTDIAFRRMQGGLVPTSCDVTPDGGSLTNKTVLFLDGIPYITGVIINATGDTSVVCE
jgi:hypothetical protein